VTELRYVYEPDEIKSRVPMEVAAAEVGVKFGQDGRALCPFHDDKNNPNFELMGPGEDGFPWAFCRACGAAVDVIELVRRVRGVAFYEALLELSALAEELPDDLKLDPPKRRAALVPDAAWDARIAECRERARGHSDVGLLSYAYGFVGDHDDQAVRTAWDEHLLDWGWGLDEAANVVIPHRAPDGSLSAVKVRYRDRSWKTFGPLKHLYGCWRVGGARAVLLCEGESDAVWADARPLYLPTDVLALPSGAGAAPADDWVEELARYEVVYLGMDEDDAGRESSKKWAARLREAGVDARRVALPDGDDLRSCGLDLDVLLTNAKGDW